MAPRNVLLEEVSSGSQEKITPLPGGQPSSSPAKGSGTLGSQEKEKDQKKRMCSVLQNWNIFVVL